MQVWRQIAQTRDIHFLRLQCLSQCRFQREYGLHENFPIRIIQVGELFDVVVPDDAAEPGIGHAIITRYAYHAPFFAAKYQFTAITIA